MYLLSIQKFTFVSYSYYNADQAKLDYDVKKLQSYVKEKTFLISEQGALADKIGPGVLKSMVTLQDKSKWVFSTILELFWIT